MGEIPSSPSFFDWDAFYKRLDVNSPDASAKLSEQTEQNSILAASWMSKLLPYIGDRKLDTICLPRSHDSGMHKLTRSLRLGSPSSTITQSEGILGQLKCGVRQFDVRPGVVNNEFRLGHYQFIRGDQIPSTVLTLAKTFLSDLIDRYHGGAGCSLDELIRDVNTFTETHNEVIVLNVSHCFNWDREVPGDEWAHLLNQDEWNRLLTQMKALKHLYVSPDGPNAALPKLKVNELIGGGTSAVIVTADLPGGVQLGSEFAGKGFFNESTIAPLTADFVTVGQSALEAVCAFLVDRKYDTVAGLVASGADFFGQGSFFLNKRLWSILQVADYKSSNDLPGRLDKFSPEQFPNSISMDKVCDQRLLSVVLRGTAKMLFGKDTYLTLENGQWKYDGH